MTREEAIKCIRNLLRGREDKRGKTEIDIALEMAIYALEQEPILDKIRAEIESIERYSTNNGHNIWLRTPEEIKKETLAIIDKYKAESKRED